MYKKATRELLLFFVFVVLILPSFYHSGDFECWKKWALALHQHGLGNVYKTEVNYPPLLMYLLSFYNFFQGSSNNIIKNINYLKIIPLLFDLLPIVILIVFRKAYELKNGYYFFLLFNIAYMYNTVVWGQVDSIHSGLVFTSIFVSFRYPILAVVLFVLSLNMKLQAIVFFPLLVLCLTTKLNSIKAIVKSIAAGLFVQLIILIPFLLAGTLKQLWTVVIGSAGYYPLASLNAFNLWHIILTTDPVSTLDSDKFLGLSYKLIGLILFFVLSAVTLFPLIIKTIKTIVFKFRPKKYQELAFLSTAIIVLLFFFVNTEMHERYSHPAMLFLFFYSLYRRKFGLYILVSIAYLLNMDKVLIYYNISHDTLIFNPKFIASLFLLAITIGVYNIYSHYSVRKDVSDIIKAYSLSRKKVPTYKNSAII